MAKRKQINAKLVGKFTEEQKRYIEAYEASCFSNKPQIQEHEKDKVEEYRWLAKIIGLNAEDTESFVENKIRVARVSGTIAANAKRQQVTSHTKKMRDA